MEADNAQAAIAEYRQFYDSGSLHPYVAIEVCDAIGWLYVKGVKDLSQAASIYKYALDHYGGDSHIVRTVPGRAHLLNAQTQHAEALKLLLDNWDSLTVLEFLSAHDIEPAVKELDVSLTALGRRKEMIDPLIRAFQRMAVLPDTRLEISKWMFATLTDLLIKEKRGDEAMGWARLRFEQCIYDRAAIQEATQFLTKVWKEADPRTVSDKANGLDAFVAAQKNAALTNPVQKYPLPKMSSEALESMLKRVGSSPDYYHWRINAYLMAGHYGDAMAEAEAAYGRDPAAAHGVVEACRVFKAADLNLKRATAIIKFLQNSEGRNPTQDFYISYPPRYLTIPR